MPTALEAFSDLERFFDGPIPAYEMAAVRARFAREATVADRRAANIADVVEIIAKCRRAALEGLAQRRRAWAWYRDVAVSGEIALQDFERIDRLARRDVKTWLSWRRRLAELQGA